MRSRDNGLAYAILGLSFIFTAVSLSLLPLGCDPPGPSAAPAASAEAPTPEKLAGIEYGVMRLCAVPKAQPPASGELKMKFSPARPVENEPPITFHDVTLKKADKGFCEYIQPDFSRLWGTRLVVKESDVALDEVGIYYLKDSKDNPGTADLTYAKLVEVKDGVFLLGVVVASPTVPVIQVMIKE